MAATLAGAGALSSSPARATPAMASEPFPDGATMLVAGPGGCAADQWAGLLMPGLARVLPGGPRLHRVLSGGLDGVTGANQFEARTEPDGATALLLPGAALTAWLVADPRAQFDIGPWVPVFAALTSGVLCARPAPDGKLRGAPIRLAAASPVGPELAGLLGLHLLGAEVTPVFGVLGADAAQEALAHGRVDAVFVQGRDAPLRVAALAAVGAVPLFAVPTMDDAGQPLSDPLFPEVPSLARCAAGWGDPPPSGNLYVAWCAVAAAAILETAMVLPAATPAAMVALWRRGSEQSLITTALRQAAAAMPARPLATAGAAGALAAVTAEVPALLELRRWLALRYGWRPS